MHSIERLKLGIGKELTDDQIIIYCLKGRYGDKIMRALQENGFRLTKYGTLRKPADSAAKTSPTLRAKALGGSLADSYIKQFAPKANATS